MDCRWNEDSPDRGLQARSPRHVAGVEPGNRNLFGNAELRFRTIVESQLLSALIETLGPLAKSLEMKARRSGQSRADARRAFVQAYWKRCIRSCSPSIGSFVAARGRRRGARALSLVGHADSEFDAAIDQCAPGCAKFGRYRVCGVKVRLINLCRMPICATPTCRSGSRCSCGPSPARYARSGPPRRTCAVDAPGSAGLAAWWPRPTGRSSSGWLTRGE